MRAELAGYEEALGFFDQKPVKLAARSALQKVATSARSIASEEIRKTYNIKKSDLDPRMVVKPPRMDNLIAEIDISGKGISLAYFGARQFAVNKVITRTKKGSRETRRRSGQFMGVAVSVTKDHTTLLRSAFLAAMKSGHIGVMQRAASGVMKSRSKYGYNKHSAKIFEKQVISLASMIQNAHVAPIVLDKVNERWGVEFPRELKHYLNKGK